MRTFNSAPAFKKRFVFFFFKREKILRFILLFAGLIINFLFSQSAGAQSIKLIPNPDGGNEYGGYIVYENHLYTTYTDATGNAHIARLDGLKLTIIPNPDSGPGITGNAIIYNNEICVRYQNQSGIYQLAECDGNSLSLIPNPDTGLGFYGIDPLSQNVIPPIIYKDKLYLPYNEELYSPSMAVFDGKNLQLVSSPGQSFFYGGEPILLNNKLYSVWYNPAGQYQLVGYDGLNFNVIPNPDKGTGFANFGYSVRPIIYNNKIYLPYFPVNSIKLAQYDGENVSLIENPDTTGYVSVDNLNPIIFNNKLYINYTEVIPNMVNGVIKLCAFDGQKLSIIPFTDLSTLIRITYFIAYNNQLYFRTSTSIDYQIPYHLTVFDGEQISVIPDAGFENYVNDSFVIYKNKLFFGYGDTSAHAYLAQYDGNSISLINNPDAGSGYLRSPVVYNDTVFFVYSGTDHIHLAYLDESVLQVSLFNFSVQLKNNNAILTWQTATEANSSYFNIQRSSDGIHFVILNKVIAAGNSHGIRTYTYTDANVDALKSGKLYYRLQEVDKDGSSAYSNIQVINLIKSNPVFFVSPNPTKDFINIVSSDNISGAQIRITDMSGSTLYSAKQNFIADQQLRIGISQFAKQVLIITIESNNSKEWFKVVKE